MVSFLLQPMASARSPGSPDSLSLSLLLPTSLSLQGSRGDQCLQGQSTSLLWLSTSHLAWVGPWPGGCPGSNTWTQVGHFPAKGASPPWRTPTPPSPAMSRAARVLGLKSRHSSEAQPSLSNPLTAPDGLARGERDLCGLLCLFAQTQPVLTALPFPTPSPAPEAA